MTGTSMKNIKSRNFKHSPIALAVALTLTVPMSINQAHAGAGWGNNANMVSKVPTYYANSPSGLHAATSCFTAAGAPAVPVLGGACDSGTALRKFVNNLPLPEVSGLANTHVLQAGDLGAGYIPIAKAEKWVNGQGLTTTDDYYEIAAIEYSERKHSDLPATGTRLRLYVQLETPGNALTSKHIALMYPDGVTPITDALKVTVANPTGQVYAYDTPHSLGPIVNATRGIATRIKFTNYLPFGAMKGAQHFLPVDKTMQSAGIGPDGVTTFTENRIAVHLHGGDGPWISSGSAHQWFAPAGETAGYAAGMGKGQSAINVPDMPDPGPGSYTMYYPNNQNGRMMWYHDQASGITRLNVYAGMAAGYRLAGPVEAGLLSSGVLPGTLTTGSAVPVADEIPVIIQDVSFVPKDIAVQDANWNVDALTNLPVPAGLQPWGQYGDLWFPHVYEINQDPNSPTGWTPVGRWDWGPWFWPVFPAQYSVPSGLVNDVTWVPNAYMDTMMVNGAVYPTLTVEPKPYRMRFMNISNDRFINLGFYLADVTSPAALAAQTATGVLGSDVSMVPFTTGLKRADGTAIVFPAAWGQVTSTMSHPAGVPDPQFTGPDIIQIGNEGGLLPQVLVTPSNIINYEWNRRSVSVSNVLEHGVFLGGGEGADTIVDFTGFAGKTLILYNDAPNMVPAGEPRVDYYTGDPDQTGQGGAETTKPGYGPNTRTVMRVVVSAAMRAGTTSTWPAGGAGVTNLIAKLPAAYAASGQQPPIVTAIAYNHAFGTTNIDNYLKIGSGSSKQPDLILAPPGNVTITSVTLADSGGWYTSMPQVVFTPPGGATGSGAAADVGASLGGITVLDPKIGGINPAAGAFPGEGYTSAPAVVFSGGTYPGGTAITWPQLPADTLKYGPLPTATAVVSPAVDAAPSLSNRGKATIAIPGMIEILPPVAPATTPRLSVPVVGWNAPVYQAIPPATVTISFPTATTYTVTGAVTGNVVGQAFVSGAKITINGYDVAITGAGVLAPVAGDVFTLTASRVAGTLAGVVFATLATPTVAAYIPGTFATVPTVTLVGGGAGVTFKPAVAKVLSSGRLNWIGMTTPPAGTPIVPYSAIPLVTFVGGGGIGATAQVHVANPIVYPIRNKGIQELYEFTYGRLNGGFSVELPFTTVAIQTTVPVAYIDPVSETLNDGETQIWKITHNGLFTHPVYFNHLDVQVINRVGWDGTIKPPYADELGWKDTVRCNQLEDVYVAVRPKAQPNAGFGVPESIRNWDPAQPVSGVGSGMGFTGASLIGSPIASDPNYNAAFGTVAPAPVNQSTPCSSLVSDYLLVGGTGATKNTCLDNEFTWTNGMLGWAELDFMRPIAFHPFVMDVRTGSATYGKWITAQSNVPAVAPAIPTAGVLAAPLAPTLLSVVSGVTGNTLTWADNSTTEYRFDILQAPVVLGVTGAFTVVGTALANATTATVPLPAVVAGTSYVYQVQAVGAKMDGLSTSAAVAVTAPVAAPATPTTPTVSLITRTTLQLNWTAPGAGTVTGYNVYQNGVLVPAANLVFGVGLNNVVVSGLTAATAYQFALQAKNGTASSAITATVAGTTTALPNTPAAPTATLIAATGFTLNWTYVIGDVSYDVIQNGVLTNVPVVVDPVTARPAATQTLAIAGLSIGASYAFSVARVASAAGVVPKVVSVQSPLLNIMLSPGVSVTPGLTTDTSITVNWATITGATDYWVYVDGQPWNYVGPGFTAGSGNLVAAGPSQSTQLNGLTPNTTYALTLMWGTAAGNSSQSVATPATTLPIAPAVPTATSTNLAATISWGAVAGATSYTLYDGGVAVYTGPLLTAVLATAAGSLHSYTLAYTTGTGVAAVTSGQSMALPVLTPLAAPTIVGGQTAVTSSGLTLSWVAGDPSVTGYTVYQNGNALASVTGTTMAITGLTAGTSYSFVVVATAGAVASAKSAVLPVVTPMTAPLITNSTSTSLTLNWSGIVGATGYTVYQNGVALPAVIGTATTRNITGLTAGVPYSYTVAYSTAAVPLSQPSAPVSVLPPPAPLAAPTAFAVSNSSVTLNWVSQATAVAPNYFIVYNNGVEIARPAPVAGVIAATSYSYTVTGLGASTSYNFTVGYNVNYGATAVSAAASPALTVTTTAAPVAAPAIPAAPAAPAATLITTTGLTLNWTAVAGATGYTVYQNGVALPVVAGTAVTRAIAGLTAGTTYLYTVVASNAGGASAQSPVLTVATTAVPLTLSNVAAPVPTKSLTAPTVAGQLTLTWPAVTGATSYVIYKNGVMLPLQAGTVPTYVVTGLTSAISYNFRVAYRNAVNVLSAPSAVYTVVAP
jgi:hypothetical protein